MPTLDEVLERYRESRVALAAIDELPAEGEPGKREQYLIRVYLAAFKTIEGAVFYEAARVLTGIANPAALNFVDAIDKLAKPLNIPQSWVSELKGHRVLRNQIEHGGGLVPRLGAIAEVLRAAERLLLEVLHVSREALEHDLPPKTAYENKLAASVWPAVFEALADPSSCASLLDDSIAKGIAQIREARTLGEVLTKTLASDAPSLLVLAARSLWEARLSPSAALPEYEPVDNFLRLETELMDAARSGRQLDPAKLRLHVRRVGLCEDAGWLVARQGKLHFAHEMVPALALGPGLVPSGETLSRVLDMVAHDPIWGLTLRGAILHAPDTAHVWLKLLREREDPAMLLPEVAAHAFVLGALRHDTPVHDAELVAAWDFALNGLILLGTREDTSLAWTFPPQTFWSCILCLASGSAALRERLPDRLGPLPTRLARLAADLELAPALCAEEAEAVAAVAMPWHALRARRFTTGISIAAQQFYGRTAVEGAHPMTPWVLSLVAPLALENEAVDLICELDHGNFGPLLIQTPKCRLIWIDAWSRIVRRDPNRATALWIRVLKDQLAPTSFLGDWNTELLQPVLTHLRAAQAESAARSIVRTNLLTWNFPEQSTDNHRALFEWAALTLDDWEAGLEHWKSKPTVSWMLLRDCGAPHTVLAHWALHFLKERETVPPAFRDGPVGIVAGPNLRALQAGPWKAAFRDARVCLDWLMAHGDAGALHIIAEASLAPRPGEAACDVPYVRSEETRLWRSLGQVFWQRVLSREAGRAVLYERLAAGKYIGINCWPIFDWRWVMDAVSHDEGILALEAPNIFQAYVRFCSVNWHPQEVRHEQPWEHPPPNIWLNSHTAMLMLAAWHGLLVLDEWKRVVLHFRTRDPMTQFGPNLAAVYARLAEQHPEAVASASPNLPNEVLGALCVDGTESFWKIWLQHVGPESFVARIEALGVQDLGTGIIIALLAHGRTALASKLTEPRYFTPFLRAARDPAIHRDEHLRRILWEEPRSVFDLEPLLHEPRGPWLDAFLELSSAWPPESRRSALVALARHASDPEVRRCCLAALSARP